MKQLLAALTCILAATLGLHGQEDTVKTALPDRHVFQPQSLPLQYKKNLKPELFTPRYRYNHTKKFDSDFTNSRLTFALPPEYPEKATVLNAPYSTLIIPAAMVSYGLIARASKPLQELDYSTHNEVCEHLQVPIRIDDYSQYAPAAAVYGLSLMGVRAKHNFRDQTIIMATSYLAMGVAVQTMKSGFNVERPDGSNSRSFPSGHTATAFVGAHMLFKEYKDVSPWIGVAGYAVATGTGALRVLNKKHWVSDVVTGAGIAILSVELGYLLLPVFHSMLGVRSRSSSFAVAPVIGIDSYGIGMTYTF